MATFTDAELAQIGKSVPPAEPARLIYRNDFTGAVLAPINPADCWGTGAFQDLIGSPLNAMWGGRVRCLLLTDPLVVTPATMGSVIQFAIHPVAGRSGTPALYNSILQSANGTAPMGWAATQSCFEFLPLHEEPTCYASLWLKLQPNLTEVMAVAGSAAWRCVTEFKTGSLKPGGGPGNDGDYRLQLAVRTAKRATPYWTLLGDNQGGTTAPYVESFFQENFEVPVPIGRWFRVEQFWRRSSGPDGRAVYVIDGRKIFDRAGPNIGVSNLPINRLMLPVLYANSQLPIYQWLDEIEVWDIPPRSASLASAYF